jgi:hypothetical protein
VQPIRRKNFLRDLKDILASFQPISLAEMDSVQLMNRTDTKFILPRHVLEEILQQLPGDYKVLDINGVRQSHYETLYFDSTNFRHFIDHQNGKKNRFKIRKRKYVESGLSFLEIKFKNNKGRTIKSRIKLPDIETTFDDRGRSFVTEKLNSGEALEPKLWNNFQRITLVNESLPERLTIDCNLGFSYKGRIVELPSLVIAEVKQESENRHSPFMSKLKARIIRPESISKYCLGVTMLYPEIKSNNFKEKILRINKINGQSAFA